MSRGLQRNNSLNKKAKNMDESSKLDPIIAVLEDYVRAVEKYEKHGDQAVSLFHRENIAYLQNWDEASVH